MKAAAFDYEQPNSLSEAIGLLVSVQSDAKVIAGGQSLAPMLNLRLSRPALLIDVTRIPELNRADSERDYVALGACITHAAIEDGRVPDPSNGVMPRIAHGIAYRAVRNRGTIGGSLAHADPAADWITTLTALGAEVAIVGAKGRRTIAVGELVVGAFETSLDGELIEEIRIPRLSAHSSWGFCKVTRKEGKFADAMAAVLLDPERDTWRAVVGATDSRPIVIDHGNRLWQRPKDLLAPRSGDDTTAMRMLEEIGLDGDSYSVRVHLVALQRALAEANRE